MRWLKLLAVCASLVLLPLCWSYRQEVAPPVLRTFHYMAARWPAGAPPVRVVFFSDVHLSDPDMRPARFARLVDRINALRPDCVLVSGDFVSTKLDEREPPMADVIAAFARLRPWLGTVLVLGNHDQAMQSAAAQDAFRRSGLQLIYNEAARCGPLAIGGTFVYWDRPSHVEPALAALARAGGVPILMSHAPDLFPYARGAGLMLAGHTHCGQIVLPFLGPISTASRWGRRYACGIVREHGRVLITSAGVGTSIAPLRWNAPPDFWLITVGPRAPA